MSALLAMTTTCRSVLSASSLIPHDSMDNLVNGRIEELIYLGDHIRVRMNVAGNDEFIVKVRNRGEKRKLVSAKQSLWAGR
jgi:hypothetical protein